MNSTEASASTRLKVGIFSALGILLIGAVTVFVNDRPYWWRKCQPVFINVEDATGLKTKSPIRSLGLEIGYLSSVELSEQHVKLGICVTAPVEVLTSTRAYIRGEGFLGDKFVELKPVRYLRMSGVEAVRDSRDSGDKKDVITAPGGSTWQIPEAVDKGAFWFNAFVPSVHAEERAVAASTPSSSREIPVGKQTQDLQQVVSQVDGLVREMTQLTANLKEGIDPKELRSTMTQLNKTLENASRTLSPEGGLNTTAQRTLAKLEEAIENLRDVMARVNRGQGSLGMLINDPTYAEEIRDVIRNINKLLGKVNEVRFVVDLGGEKINGYTSGRAWLKLQMYPRKDRYYLVGVSTDPRGKRTVKQLTVATGGVSTTTTTTEVEEGGILFNLMFGKIFKNRYEFALGLLHGDGTGSGAIRLGPVNYEEALIFRTDVYSRGKGYGLDARFSVVCKPFSAASILSTVYLRGGLESLNRVDGKLA